MAKNNKVSQARKAFVKARVEAFRAKNPEATVNDLAGIRTGARQRFDKLATSVKGRTTIVKQVGEAGGRKDLRAALKSQYTKPTVKTSDTTSGGTTGGTTGNATTPTLGRSQRDSTPYVPSRASSSMMGAIRDATPYIRAKSGVNVGNIAAATGAAATTAALAAGAVVAKKAFANRAAARAVAASKEQARLRSIRAPWRETPRAPWRGTGEQVGLRGYGGGGGSPTGISGFDALPD